MPVASVDSGRSGSEVIGLLLVPFVPSEQARLVPGTHSTVTSTPVHRMFCDGLQARPCLEVAFVGFFSTDARQVLP
ncbi:hypothetical protein ACFWJS_01710 [Streptomyces sp. NPDC127061]|uniref:hypothetical protein n=1 Tax=unclassified Streptomyces TaxID=2593676 RepID=UPI00363B3077